MLPQLRHVAGAARRAKTNHRRITAVQKPPLLRMVTGLWASSGGAASGAWAGSHARADRPVVVRAAVVPAGRRLRRSADDTFPHRESLLAGRPVCAAAAPKLGLRLP